jgi:hypothetical protein
MEEKGGRGNGVILPVMHFSQDFELVLDGGNLLGRGGLRFAEAEEGHCGFSLYSGIGGGSGDEVFQSVSQVIWLTPNGLNGSSGSLVVWGVQQKTCRF